MKICVAIGHSDPPVLIQNVNRAFSAGADLVEVRFDYLEPTQILDAANRLKEFVPKCIFTLRSEDEGGRFSGSEMQRLELLRELVKHKPALIDVELATLKKNDELADFLDASGARVLVSWHDFDATPPLERLEAILDEMTLFSNYVKVVTMARTIEDSLRILNLYDTPRASYAIIFAMGEPGAISRVLCTIIGNAPFTYASLESPTAPGQISLSAMRKLYNSLKHNKKIV